MARDYTQFCPVGAVARTRTLPPKPLERLCAGVSNHGQIPRLQPVLQIGGILLTFHFVALGWVFFALSEPSLSWMVFRKLFRLALQSGRPATVLRKTPPGCAPSESEFSNAKQTSHSPLPSSLKATLLFVLFNFAFIPIKDSFGQTVLIQLCLSRAGTISVWGNS